MVTTYKKMGKYLCEHAPDHPRATKEGYVYVHILVAEKKLGRYLKDGECVYHIDKNKLNNSIDNLMVFKTLADHTAFHSGKKATLEGDVYVCNDKVNKNTVKICPMCNVNIINPYSLYCRSCAKKIYIQDNKLSKKPSRDVLKKDVYNHSFTYVGKKYGVTSNSVKKWLKSYGLPYLRNVIDNIPIDEWFSEEYSDSTLNAINKYR